MTYTLKDMKNNAVKVVYYSQHKIILLLDNQKIEITPAIDNHSCDDAVAFLEYELLDND